MRCCDRLSQLRAAAGCAADNPACEALPSKRVLFRPRRHARVAVFPNLCDDHVLRQSKRSRE